MRPRPDFGSLSWRCRINPAVQVDGLGPLPTLSKYASGPPRPSTMAETAVGTPVVQKGNARSERVQFPVHHHQRGIGDAEADGLDPCGVLRGAFSSTALPA